jgi:hypothetical protein
MTGIMHISGIMHIFYIYFGLGMRTWRADF